MRPVVRGFLGVAVAGALLAVAPQQAGAWTPNNYFYGTGSRSSGMMMPGGDGFSTGDACKLEPAYTETESINPEEDTRTYATLRHVTHVIPRKKVNVEHVYHHLNKVNHVMHDVNQDVYIKNVRVHHNVEHEQTVHHYRHRTNYVQQDTEETVYDKEILPTRYESDCDTSGDATGGACAD